MPVFSTASKERLVTCHPDLIKLFELVVAVYDFCQRRHTLWRNYPLLAHVRWMMEDLRPYARAYLVEGDLEGRPFNHQQRHGLPPVRRPRSAA